MPGRLALLLATLPLMGCASLSARLRPAREPDVRYERALEALDQADYAAARSELAWLVSRCEAGRRGRSALLLLASAELDVRNPEGSPAEAARLAGAYLRLPWVDEEEVPIARTLYLLAIDRSLPGMVTAAAADEPSPEPDTARPELATRFEHCEGGGEPEATRPLPEHPGTPAAAERAWLEKALAQHTDSLAAARMRVAGQAERIRELEAEIERIRKLLRGGRGSGGGASRPDPR